MKLEEKKKVKKKMSSTFLRVTWIDLDREVERDVSTREQKALYKLDVNVKVKSILRTSGRGKIVFLIIFDDKLII